MTNITMATIGLEEAASDVPALHAVQPTSAAQQQWVRSSTKE